MSQAEELLASRQGLGRVQRCACGTIHVSVGPVELKFTAESLVQTFEMMRDAVDRLNSPDDEAAQLEQTAQKAPRSFQN